jgi:hypothetical protein
MYESNSRCHTPVTSVFSGRNLAEIIVGSAMAQELTGHRVQMLVGGRGQRALIHGVIVLSRLQLLLIVALSAPSAIRAKYDILTIFHFRLPISIIRSNTNGSEIDISDDDHRKKLSTMRRWNRGSSWLRSKTAPYPKQ